MFALGAKTKHLISEPLKGGMHLNSQTQFTDGLLIESAMYVLVLVCTQKMAKKADELGPPTVRYS